MRLRLSQLTIPNVVVKPYFLEDEYWRGVDFKNLNNKKHPQDDKLIEIYINAKNNTSENMNVTSDHIKIYENGIELGDKFDPAYPLLIIQLRPGEVFSCRCIAVLSIAINNDIFAASGNTFFKEINDNEFKMTIESQGQMDEYEILHKACNILKDKINITKESVKENFKEPKYKDLYVIKLELEGEDHTLGCIINDFLQTNKNIVFSGVSKPNLLIDTMVIQLQTIKKNPLPYILESLDHILLVFDEIETQIMKLGKKFITYI